MDGVRARTRALALVVAGVALAGGGLAAAPPSSADGTLTVTWPAIVEFNPTSTDYVIDVQHTGTGHLFLSNSSQHFGSVLEPVASNGQHQVTFPENGSGTRILRLLECPTATWDNSACGQRGPAHYLEVYSELRGGIPGFWSFGPSEPLPLITSPDDAGDLDVVWEVVPRWTDGPVLASGSASGVPSGTLPPISPAGDLVHGDEYEYRATISGTVEPFGHLEGEVTRVIEWDSVNEARGVGFKVKDAFLHRGIRDVEVFYPAEDPLIGWRDELVIRLDAGEAMAEVRTTIKDLDGDVVMAVDDATFAWSGRDESGELLPEGWYNVAIEAVDRAGNPKVVNADVLLSHERLVQTTWKRTVKPTQTMLDKYVGRCADLRKPARPGWAGSLSYRTEPRCKEAAHRAVATSHGIHVPSGPFREHLWVRVDTVGGASADARGSTAEIYQYNKRSDWIGHARLSPHLRTHRGNQVSAVRAVLGDVVEDPYVIWSVGLNGGRGYDVKTFTVNVRYWDVR